MNSLKNLKALFQRLTEKEVSILYNYFGKNRIVVNKELKSLQLIELLKKGDDYSFIELQKILYNKINYYAFNKLIIRLKDKIFEIILREDSLKSNEFSKRNQLLLSLRKKLLQADVLQLKGDRKIVVPIYDHIIKYAKKFELYEILVQALKSSQRLLSTKSKSVKFKKLILEIENAEECLRSLNDSTIIYGDIINMISNAENFSFYKESLINSISRINNFYRKTNSPTIGFYLFTLETDLFQNEYDYTSAQRSLEKAKINLVKSESAFTNNRYGTILLNLSNNCIYLNEFDKAIEYASESKIYFKNLTYSLLVVDEILFFCFLYKRDLINCKNILSITNKIEDSNLKNKFYYYNAYTSFIEGNYELALRYLRDLMEVERDKEGWNLNIRILEILIKIELKDHEAIDLLIQNLEKFIKRVVKNKMMHSRYKIIVKILSSLIIENLDFEKTLHKRKKYFELLESSNPQYKWLLKSPELLSFTVWYRSKINDHSHKFLKT